MPHATGPAFQIDFDFVDGARWDDELAEFVLPHELVRTAAEPDTVLLAFLRSSYEAAATKARWDRAAFKRPDGDHDG
jgi:hypothetical protein